VPEFTVSAGQLELDCIAPGLLVALKPPMRVMAAPRSYPDKLRERATVWRSASTRSPGEEDWGDASAGAASWAPYQDRVGLRGHSDPDPASYPVKN
jgi:hypothetical protein